MDGEGGAKARILVVDDSRLMRKAAHKMLGEEFDVVTADDGEDAWTQLQADNTIQVVFTDLNMPLCDGYELLRRVRDADDASVQALPVIVVTGAENDETARMQALDMGATDFITKPFTTIDLIARARAHANNQRITRRLQAQSTLDGLTGLANNAGFLDRLQQDLAYSRRHQHTLSVVRLELDDFRRFFLYHGRELAETVVLQVARLLRARIRKEDTAGRIGLGGFALSMPGGDPQGITGMLDRLRAEMAASPPLDENGAPIRVVLTAAVVSPGLDQGHGAQAVLDLCQSLLTAPTEPEAPSVIVATATAAAVEGMAGIPALAPAAPPTPSATPATPATPARVGETAPASHAPASEAAPAVATAANTAAATATPTAAVAPAESLRVDPLLDQIAQGDPRPAMEKLPQVIGRLLPFLRLLGPNQRAQLIQFLQRLG